MENESVFITSCDRAACFCNFPGLENAKALGLRSWIVSWSVLIYFEENRTLTSSVLFLFFFCLPMRLVHLVVHGKAQSCRLWLKMLLLSCMNFSTCDHLQGKVSYRKVGQGKKKFIDKMR